MGYTRVPYYADAVHTIYDDNFNVVIEEGKTYSTTEYKRLEKWLLKRGIEPCKVFALVDGEPIDYQLED